VFSLSADAIDPVKSALLLRNEQSGAVVVFEGCVRNRNQGKFVTSLEYQAYEVLAQKDGEKILSEAREKFNIHQAICLHRFGHLLLGETAVWIGVTASHRDEAYKASRHIIDQIKLRLPIWKKEHYRDETPEWVFCKDHSSHVHFNQSDYYQRQSGLVDQAKLDRSRVLVIGAGGLGCPVLTALAQAGVGRIEIADFDRVSLSNLHRQSFYSPEVVGESKSVIAKNRVAELNPFIQVLSHDSRIDIANVGTFISGRDLILDCTDNLDTKYLIHDACFKHRIPLISASVYRHTGQVRSFDPEGDHGCLRCIQTEAPDDSQIGNCNEAGTLGAVVSAIGAIQANEAIEFLQSHRNSTLVETFFMNFSDLATMKVRNFKNRECACCRGEREIEETEYEVSLNDLIPSEVELVDIRNHPDDYLERLQNQTAKKIVVYCHRGIRSKRLVRDQRELGFSQFYSLRGGACSL